MPPIFDFICPQGHVAEHMARDIHEAIHCPTCKELSVYKPAMPHFAYMQMGADPRGCPTAADKWAKAHEQGGKLK